MRRYAVTLNDSTDSEDNGHWIKSNMKQVGYIGSNKLASSVDAIAISEIWNYHLLTHWLTDPLTSGCQKYLEERLGFCFVLFGLVWFGLADIVQVGNVVWGAPARVPEVMSRPSASLSGCLASRRRCRPTTMGVMLAFFGSKMARS